jgi:hypothetical protein
MSAGIFDDGVVRHQIILTTLKVIIAAAGGEMLAPTHSSRIHKTFWM